MVLCKNAHFYLKTFIHFNALNMLSALRSTYLTYGMHRDGEPCLDIVKKRNTFSSTKLLTRVTVADKLVLVNPF